VRRRHTVRHSKASLVAAALLLPHTAAGLVAHSIGPQLRHCASVAQRTTVRRYGDTRCMEATADLPPPIVPRFSFQRSGQTITLPGLTLGFAVFATAFVVQIPVFLCYLWAVLFDKQRRRYIDWVIHFWAWTSMTVCGYSPEVVGLENLDELRKTKKNCLFVPNHASFLDILTLTGFIPMPMKYVSKEEILKIPLIGWPMALAGHIALQTASRRSQLQTFKDTVQSLEDGNSVITFPEGGRSIDGALKPFKRGPFKMAIRAGTPIVPVSICGLARWYPKGTLLPLAVPKDVRVVIHEPIDVTKSGMGEGELCEHVYSIVNSALPPYQQGPSMAPAAA